MIAAGTIHNGGKQRAG